MFDQGRNAQPNTLFSGLGLQLEDLPASDLEALSQFGLAPKPSMAPSLGVGAGTAEQFSLLQKLFGGALSDGTKTLGAVSPILQGAGALGNLWMGMQNYGLAKDSLKEGKRQFDLNYGAQRDSVNTQMEDRQKARYASNPNFYESPESYMDRNRIR